MARKAVWGLKKVLKSAINCYRLSSRWMEGTSVNLQENGEYKAPNTHDERVKRGANLKLDHKTSFQAGVGGIRFSFLEDSPRFKEWSLEFEFWWADVERRFSEWSERNYTLYWSLIALFMIMVVLVILVGLYWLVHR